jgi:hypothetical protein
MGNQVKQFRDLNLKPGDKVRYMGDCALRGLEIEVPDMDKAIVVSNGDAAILLSRDQYGLRYGVWGCAIWGDDDKWEEA